MDTPTYNAEGMQIYKPQPGEYWKHGLKFRESYGGIIAEIQDIIQEQAGNVKTSYPQNFAGIIAALNDLGKVITAGNLPNVNDKRPGWEIIVNPDGSIDGDWQVDPPDGTLWFDNTDPEQLIEYIYDGTQWIVTGNYVKKKGGDAMEGQLIISGPRNAGDDVDNPDLVSSDFADFQSRVAAL
jgi:hypothetical protein